MSDTTTKRADQLNPGDTVSAWGVDEVVRTAVPGTAQGVVGTVVEFEQLDDQGAVIIGAVPRLAIYPPGTVVEFTAGTPEESDRDD